MKMIDHYLCTSSFIALLRIKNGEYLIAGQESNKFHSMNFCEHQYPEF